MQAWLGLEHYTKACLVVLVVDSVTDYLREITKSKAKKNQPASFLSIVWPCKGIQSGPVHLLVWGTY